MPRKEYYYSADQRDLRAKNRRLQIAQALKNPNTTLVNGRIIVRKTDTATCQTAECGKVFSFVMTTKPHRYCDECKATREKERLGRRVWTPRKERLAPASQSPRQVRYAGYDPSEQSLEGNNDDA